MRVRARARVNTCTPPNSEEAEAEIEDSLQPGIHSELQTSEATQRDPVTYNRNPATVATSKASGLEGEAGNVPVTSTPAQNRRLSETAQQKSTARPQARGV